MYKLNQYSGSRAVDCVFVRVTKETVPMTAPFVTAHSGQVLLELEVGFDLQSNDILNSLVFSKER